MSEIRTPWLVAFLISSVRSSLALIFGGGFLWYGISLGDMPLSPRQPIGQYSFHIGGAIFIAAGLSGFVYNLMRLRVPKKAKDDVGEVGGNAFDADAALAHYMANREADSGVKPSENI